MTRLRWTLATALLLLCQIETADTAEVPPLETYFHELRRRELFSLGENYALTRLADERLSLDQRTSLTIELSRTLAEHAAAIGGSQQAELWQRAAQVVRDLRAAEPENPRLVLLRVQEAMVRARHGESLRWQVELQPLNERQRAAALSELRTAAQQLSDLAETLDRQTREPRSRTGAAGLKPHELRSLLHHVRFRLGQVRRDSALLLEPESPDRMAALLDAEQAFRKLSAAVDEELDDQAQLLLAQTTRLRGDLKRAGEMLTAIESRQPPPRLVESLVAERVRWQLASSRADEALQSILRYRRANPLGSGEIQFLAVETLVELVRLAARQGDEALVRDLHAQLAREVQRTEEEFGGYWAARARNLNQQLQRSEQYGETLAALAQAAQADYLNGRLDEALAGYAEAAAQAEQSGQSDLALELGYTRGSILLQSDRFAEAAQQFLSLAEKFPNQSRTASAHLLGAYSLGRLYDQQRTRSRRLAYTEALETHRSRFAEDSTYADATFLLAQLEEQRLQNTKALQLYQEVPPDHRRGPEAQAGIARCFGKILRRLDELNHPSGEWQQLAIEQLEGFLVTFPKPNAGWTTHQAEVALQLARVRLSGKTPEFARADELLQQVETAWQVAEEASRTAGDPVWARLVKESRQWRILSLAGQHRPEQALERLHELDGQPQQMLEILDGLAQLPLGNDATVRRRLGELQLQASESLQRRRAELSPEQQQQLDRCLGEAYVATQQPQRAVEVYQRLLQQSPGDKALMRTVGDLLMQCGTGPCIEQARTIWRKLESLEQQGTPEWLAARYEVARSCLALGESEECRKLVTLTRLLYPELGGPTLRARFAELEQEARR